MPAVDQYEEEEFEGEGDHDRGQELHADGDQHGGDDHVDDEEGEVDAEAHEEGDLEFA